MCRKEGVGGFVPAVGLGGESPSGFGLSGGAGVC